MADTKISDLPAATTVADADIVPIVQSTANKKSALSVIKTYLTTAFDALYVPLERTLTINGDTEDLSANRSWTVTVSAIWGTITGTLSDQTDLQSALDAKQPLDTQLTSVAGLSYGGNSLKVVRVNTGETSFELATPAAPGTGTVTSITATAPVVVTPDPITATGDISLDATTADVPDSTNRRYVTDAQLTVIGNTSGTNTGDQQLFKTISVIGQSDVVADSTSDTLHLVAGANITILTDPSSDSIGIAAAGAAATDWGDITGTLSDQTDLQGALDAKAPAARMLTINGDAKDLSADRIWTVTPTVAAPDLCVSKIYSAEFVVPETSCLVMDDYIEMDAGADLIIPSGSSLLIHAPSKITTTSDVTVVKVKGRDFFSTSITGVNVDGLSVPVVANSLYEVSIMIAGQSSTSAGVACALFCSGSGQTGAYYFTGSAGTAAAVGNAGLVNAAGGGSAFWTVANTDLMIYGSGLVKTAANPGNITLVMGKMTGGSLNVYTGSRMTVTKLN